MAILRGFPPSNTISPSVRISERDLSFVPPDQSFHRAGLVGFASKGPINIPTLIANTRQLNTIFGFPHPEVGDPYLIYAAQQYLLVANELFVVRVGVEDEVDDEKADIAEVEIPSAGGQIDIISDTAELYSFAETSFFRWRLNGVLASKTLVVLADSERDAPLTGTPYTCLQLVEDLNLQLDPVFDGIEFYCTTDSRIAVRTTFAFGPDSSLELVSVQSAIYGGPTIAMSGTNVTGLGQGMTVASITGDNDRYPNDGYQVAGTWDFTGLTGLNLQVVVDGTDNVTIDNIVQVIDLEDLEGLVNTTAEIVTEINSQITAGTLPGGFEAVATGDNLTLRTLHHGRDARLLVKTESTAGLIFGFDNLTVVGTSPSGVSGDAAIHTFGIVIGDSNTTGDITFTITADTPGIDGNATQVNIFNDSREPIFTIEVINGGDQVESWGGLTKDQSSRFYVETFLSTTSDWIRAYDNTDTPAPPLDGVYDLSGGSDGIPADPDEQDDLLIGSSLGFTGLFALSEPEQIDIDIIAIPGHPSTSIVLAMIEFCENFRQDCLALVDPPFGLTVNEIVDWQNGTHPLNTVRFDSDFAALYWPWLKIRDTHNRVDVWVPPSGSVMAVYARNDQLAAAWFAPAGVTRGEVPSVLDVFNRPTLAERDLMYGNRNAVNAIVQFADFEGFLVWGQKTLQRTPTALDRVNVRRMLFVAEKRIRAQSRNLLFDPHDEIFRQRFIDLATEILRDIQVGRGLTDFIIDASEELNTPDVIDRNEFRARIGLQPTRAVEFIFIEFSL
ncbi:MAG: phage tail sheath subtilisin-like domain-containing protein, partial [Candidatus Thorarchaeota archaeon]